MPDDVEQFRAVHYTRRKWISENHKRSDDPGQEPEDEQSIDDQLKSKVMHATFF